MIGIKASTGRNRNTTPRQMNWALSVFKDIQKEKELKVKTAGDSKKLEDKQFNQPLRHFTLRLAWHDTEWNGHVCRDPLKNRYCSGYHSLLSERQIIFTDPVAKTFFIRTVVWSQFFLR